MLHSNLIQEDFFNLVSQHTDVQEMLADPERASDFLILRKEVEDFLTRPQTALDNYKKNYRQYSYQNIESNVIKIMNKIKSGNFYGVIFTKNNGEYRFLYGHHKIVENGQGKKFKDEDHNLVTVFDNEKEAFRSYHFDKVICFLFDRTIYSNYSYSQVANVIDNLF